MADYDVRVVMDPSQAVTGSKKVEGSLKRVGDSADRVNSLIKRAFAFTSAGLLTQQLYRQVDAYANLQNRIRVVTTSTAQLNRVTEELFKISQQTRSSFAGSVELYSRLALSTKELGVGEKQLIQFTKSLNQAVILSGASAQEANAGIIQLSQGIASGTLRGDELQSVLEQLPAVADVIAKSMKKTRGELRLMGEQGKITAETVLDAFAEARVELEERFAKSLITPSQSLQVLRNAILKTVGGFDQASGASGVFARAMVGLANNIDGLVRSIAALAIVIGTTLAAQAVPKAIAAMRALSLVIAANPLGALLIGLTTAISFLITFSDRIFLTGDRLVNLQDIAEAVWNRISNAVAKFVDFFRTNFGFVFDFAEKVFGGINLSVKGVLLFGANIIDRYIGIWISAFKIISGLFQQLPILIKNAMINALNGAIGIVESKVNFLVGKVNALLESFGDPKRFDLLSIEKLGGGVEDTGVDIGKIFGDGIKSGLEFSGVSGFVDGIIGDATVIALKRNEEALSQNNEVAKETIAVQKGMDQKFSDIIKKLQAEAAALRLTSSEREIQLSILKAEEKLKRGLTDAESVLLESQLKINQGLTTQAALFDQIKGPIEEYKNTVSALNSLLAEGKINSDEFNNALASTALAQGLSTVQADLAGGGAGPELQALQDQLSQRSEILRQAREAELLTEQEFLDLSMEAHRIYNAGLIDLETARYQMQLQAAAGTFDSLSQIAKTYAGEQSGIYKSLFAVSKAFAIADSTVQVANALAKAANSGPFPANLGAIAGVAAATSSLVSTIQGASFQPTGFQNGGNFKVGGSGGTDSQLVQFRASPNETVSVKTPGQEKVAQAPAPAQKEGGGVRIINVVDPDLVNDFMSSPQGEEVLINSIQRNQGQVKQILKG